MSKNEFKQINVDNEIFKRIKNYKRTIYAISNEETVFQEKQKVIICNNKTNKKLKRKIVKIYPQNNLEDLKIYLKKKSKYIYSTNVDNDKITAVEFKYNKKIFRKILLFILLVFLSWFLVLSINNFISKMNDKEIKSVLNDFEREKISYVFIEINPSFVLTVKDNIVTDIACLNDDCISFYNEIDVKNKSIDDSISSLYNLSKDKGFNVTDGVKVKTTDKINIKTEDYISIEYIDNNTKKELLSNIKNNEEIKNNNNENYYSNLLEELKKDNDYGKVYECNKNNEELECYIKKDFVIHTYDDEKASSITDIVTIIKIWSTEISPNLNRLERVLKKFGVQVDADDTLDFMINPIGYVYVDGVRYSTVILPQTPDEIEYDAKIKCDIYGFKLTDINLLKPNNTPVKILLEEDEIDYNINPIVIDIFDSFDCSNKYCKKITQRDETKYVCDNEYGEYMWHEEYKEGGLIPIIKYEICDANKSNCRVVSKDYFNKFSLEYGNLYDLPECKKDYTTRCNDMNYCYVNNSNSYCRSKSHLNGEWIAQGPNY